MENIVNYIRNVLRTEGITGMDSVSHCIVFIVFRMMTPKLCKSVGMDESLAFENAIYDKDGEELGAQELFNKFFYTGNAQLNFVGEFVNKLNFKNFKFKLEGIQNLKNIVDKMKTFDIEHLATKYDIIGTIYELHLKSGTSKGAMRDLGQYYTHRLVIKYMVELCKPCVKKGMIEKIVDPTLGTGGFLTMAIKYLNNKYKDIDWKKNKANMFGFDIDDNVKNMALLNIFLEIGHLCKDTVVKQDTLYCDMTFPMGGTLEKADIILANEPMGLKNINYESCCPRIKNLKIEGTKAEPLFMQLFMEALADGGRCAVIIPDGVLFNESNQHQGTRKHLVENFNLKKVVALKDDDFFLNTGVKTSILFFEKNGGKTKEVDFCEITINEKGDIEETSIIKASYKEIKDMKYSLFVNKYNVEEVAKIEGVEYKKLGDLCEFINGKNITKSQLVIGEYPVVGGGKSPMGYHNEYTVNAGAIIISKDGAYAGYVSMYNTKVFVSNHGIYMANFKNNIKKDYVYYYMSIHLQQSIYKLQTGSAQPGVNKRDIGQLKLPIPSLKVQEAIVERLDLLSDNNATMAKNIEQLKAVLKYYIGSSTKGCNQEKLGDVCELKSGKYNSSDCSEKGEYPFYNSKASNPDGFTDKFCFDYPSYLILIKDGGAGYKKYGDQIGLGKVFKVCGRSGATCHQLALINRNDCTSTEYLYYFLSSIKNNIMDLAMYTTGLGTIRKSKLEELMVPLPSKEKQKEIVEYCDNLMDMIQKQEKQIELNKELMKNIMDDYLNSNNSANDTDSDKSIDSDSDSGECHTVKDSDSEDEEPTKQGNKLRIIKKHDTTSEEDSEDEKPKKQGKKLKIIKKRDTSSEEDSKGEKPKKVKVIKKSSVSDSSKDTKSKKNIKKTITSDEEESEEEPKKQKVIKKSKKY